jgi:hypothetical protein
VIRAVVETVKHLFHPRHSNNHRARLLHSEWLVVFSVMACFSLLGLRFFQSYSEKLGYVLGYASDITVDQTLVLTNQERAKSGLAPLSLNAKLSSAASAKASDMFQNQYWAHVSPSGKEPWSFITASGYSYRLAGENLARDFNHTTDMVIAWMNSPTHRANIMNGRYTEIGLAVVNGQLQGIDTTLVVQMFGAPNTGSQPQLARAAAVVEPPAPTATRVPTLQPTAVPLVAQAITSPQTSPTLIPAIVQGQTQLLPPRTEVLSRQLFPSGSVRPLDHINPLSLMKAFFISILVVLMFTLVYDLYAIGHYHSLRIVGKNFAHLLFFATVAFLLIFFKSGAVI